MEPSQHEIEALDATAWLDADAEGEASSNASAADADDLLPSTRDASELRSSAIGASAAAPARGVAQWNELLEHVLELRCGVVDDIANAMGDTKEA